MQAQRSAVEVQVPKTAAEFNTLAERILQESDLETIHILADALAVGLREGDVFVAEFDEGPNS